MLKSLLKNCHSKRSKQNKLLQTRLQDINLTDIKTLSQDTNKIKVCNKNKKYNFFNHKASNK